MTSTRPTDRLPPILVVLHQEHSTPGRLGRMLVRRGHPLDVRRPRFGDPLPTSLADHAGVVVFGGPMSANDEEAWIHREIDWIGVALAEEKPFLGVCLGAQMLVRRLGGRVYGDAQSRVEIGWFPLRPTEAGRALGDWPERVYEWHTEGFDVPVGATLLASGERFPNQAIRWGRAAFGIQFHPELTWAMMNRWTVRAAHRLALPGAQSRPLHFEGRSLYDHQTLHWAEQFLDRWLAAGDAPVDRCEEAGTPTPPPGGR
jgi:GMP synthase (glutamine-hydrolysing)